MRRQRRGDTRRKAPFFSNHAELAARGAFFGAAAPLPSRPGFAQKPTSCESAARSNVSWLVLAALSAVFLGLYDVSKKASLDDNAVLPVLFACTVVGALLLVPVVSLGWWQPDLAEALGVRIAPLGSRGHFLVFVKAMIVTLSWVLTYFALKHLPISFASPIRASAPIFTVLGALLLFGETPAPLQLLGITAAIGSYYAFSVLGRSEGMRLMRSRWVGWLVLGTLVGAGSGLYDKHLLQTARLAPMSVQLYFTLYAALLQAVLVSVFWWPRRTRTTPFEPRLSIVWVALLLLLADSVYFRALSVPGAQVSLVSALRRSNVAISFLVGGLLFGEKIHARKVLALAGVLVGVSLILGGG